MEIAGRYRLDREIGRGGMGAVWLGVDGLLGRQVALKRLGAIAGADGPDLDRAEREARLAARLNHPHVVAIFDLVADGGDHWLVMEYVAGTTLAERVREHGPLTATEVAGVLRQVADALAAAHAAGIVHRDVKPSNILLADDGRVKLSDFGIARAEQDSSLTQTGLVTGSPAYLAPEVASGRTATAAADVWSLGATAYHALAGHPPYEVGDNVMGALYRIVHEPPPRLDGVGRLATLLEHTMDREPGDRWPMAQVKGFLDTETPAQEDTRPLAPVLPIHPPAPEPSTVPAPARPTPAATRRRPRRAVLGLALLAAAVVVFVGLAWVFGAFDRSDEAGSEPPTPGTSATDGTGGGSGDASPDPGEARAAAMRGFVTDYVASAISDPRTSWGQLTPDFQKASRGYGSYRKFWDQWASAVTSDVTADTDASTVTYAITYTRPNGETTQGTVTLLLEQSGDGYLIADEL